MTNTVDRSPNSGAADPADAAQFSRWPARIGWGLFFAAYLVFASGVRDRDGREHPVRPGWAPDEEQPESPEVQHTGIEDRERRPVGEWVQRTAQSWPYVNIAPNLEPALVLLGGYAAYYLLNGLGFLKLHDWLLRSADATHRSAGDAQTAPGVHRRHPHRHPDQRSYPVQLDARRHLLRSTTP